MQVWPSCLAGRALDRHDALLKPRGAIMLRGFLLLLWAGSAMAQDGLATAQGAAVIAPAPGSDAEALDLIISGQIVPLGGASPAHLWIEAQAGAVLLIGRSDDTAACPAMFQWVRVSEVEIAVTPPFGTCAEGPELRFDSLGITVRLAIPGKTMAVDYFYDGVRIVETVVQR